MNIKQQLDCRKEIALATNNELLCEYLGPVEKDQCVYKIAKATLNVELCTMLEQPINRDSCRLKIARLSENKEYCDLISFKEIKATCLADFN